MLITMNNFEELLVTGYFSNVYLTEEEATIAGDWITKHIIATKRSPEFLDSWNHTNKTVTSLDYLTHLYTCCLSLQYFYDSDTAVQTQNNHIIDFCIKLLEFIQKNDPEFNQITGRQYWHKISQLFHVKEDYDTELKIINEGIKILSKSTNWKPGALVDIERMTLKYSNIEALYAHKIRCLVCLSRVKEANENLKVLLSSLAKRGLTDYFSGLFPAGVKSLV